MKRADELSWSYERAFVPDLLLSLIGIDTRNGNTPGAKYALEIIRCYLEANGITDVNTGENNGYPFLTACLKGRKDGGGLLLFSHIDTADWKEESWSMPPLGARDAGGRIYGRGAVDCKALCAAQATLLAAFSAGSRPLRDLRLIITSDEESGGCNGMGCAAVVNESVSACNYALGEGGGYILPEKNKALITCQIGERGRLFFPALESADIPSRIIPDRGACRNHLRLRRQRVLDRRIDPSGRFTTFEISDGIAVLNIAPGADMNRLRNYLHKEGLPDLSVAGRSFAPAFESCRRSRLYRAIRRQVFSHGFRLVPAVSPGYSDARFLRAAGLDVYGFFPMGFRERISAMHGPDEHIHEETLFEALKILKPVIDGVIN